MTTNRPSALVPSKITESIKDFRFCATRPKVSGCMWSGSATSTVESPSLGLVEVKLKLHHHGGDIEDESSLKSQLVLDSVEIKDLGEVYDAYWHCLWNEEELWLNRKGWFEIEDDALELKSKIPIYNPHLKSRMMDLSRLLELGFIKLF